MLVGAVVSILTVRVAVLALPAKSLTLALNVVLAASAGMVLPKLALHVPVALTVAVWVMLPHTTVTVWPCSASLVPVTVMPPALAARLTTSVLPTVLPTAFTVSVGAPVSTG